MNFKSWIAAVGLSVLPGLLSGCGGVGDAPQLGEVTGTVTLDSQPLAGVEVAFHPTEGRPAFGTTDAEGNYSLNYMPGEPGCKIGTNRVTIGNEEGGADENEMEGDDVVQSARTKRPVIPAKYNTKSELTAEVKAGENVLNFDLTSK